MWAGWSRTRLGSRLPVAPLRARFGLDRVMPIGRSFDNWMLALGRMLLAEDLPGIDRPLERLGLIVSRR